MTEITTHDIIVIDNGNDNEAILGYNDVTTSHAVVSSRKEKSSLAEMRSITKRFFDVLALSNIPTICQNLNQAPQLSMTKNIFLGSKFTRRPMLV